MSRCGQLPAEAQVLGPVLHSLFQRSLKSSWSHCILIVCLHTYLLHEPLSASPARSWESGVHRRLWHKIITSKFLRKEQTACRLPGLCCALAALCAGRHLLPRFRPFSIVSRLDSSRMQFLLRRLRGPPGPVCMCPTVCAARPPSRISWSSSLPTSSPSL